MAVAGEQAHAIGFEMRDRRWTDAALDDYITVTFTVSPAVRAIRFHKPDALSAWDYVFHYKLTPGGVGHIPGDVPSELRATQPGLLLGLGIAAARRALSMSNQLK